MGRQDGHCRGGPGPDCCNGRKDPPALCARRLVAASEVRTPVLHGGVQGGWSRKAEIGSTETRV